VAADNRDGFLSNLKAYVVIMALQGLFNAGYSAAFSVVSRKILYQVRKQLFAQIVDQDVAFFDGTTSGHLTSKLTNDISLMMEPIRASLSTLLYNGVTLFGGVAMCYWTSYQLSMLAFVTVSTESKKRKKSAEE
jgi:ABC-type multidrug transport system fused ATPase/permease subunit